MNCPRCQKCLGETAQFCDSCGHSRNPAHAPTEKSFSNLDTTLTSTDPLIGRVLDSKYELISLLGAGGMGAVYRARRVHIGDEAAVKVLRQELVAHEASIERFRREARAAALLHHANIVTIHDFGEGRSDGVPAFIVMELLEGESIRAILKREGKVEPTRAVLLMRDICAGVGAGHRRGIVHRDLKPDNVMVLPPSDDRGREIVKVVDFGIAKLRDLASVSTLTETGSVLGTAYYMSPEQCRGQHLDSRSDVYSLGVMFYEMLAGTPPFVAATMTGVVAKHLTEAPPPLGEPLGIPASLEELVMRSLAKNPDERPVDARELARQLQTVINPQGQSTLSQVPALTTRASDPPAPSLKGQRRFASLAQKHRRRIALGSVVLLIVLALAVGVFKLFHYSQARPGANIETTSSERSSVAVGKGIYWQMSQDERGQFVGKQSERISAMLGPNPYSFDQGSVDKIKQELDKFVARKDSLSTDIFKESLRPMYSRASVYAPFIIQAFNERRVPAIIGLYIAMIETEYHPCSEGQFGGKGLFAFAAETGLKYGLDPKDRCDPRANSRAAARYTDDLISEFGSDSASVTLVLLSYNRGEEGVRNDLHRLVALGNRERSFWALAVNEDKLDERFRTNGIRYVPTFFAAAIIGENPQAFDLHTQPLSSYAEVKNQPNAH